MNTIVSIVIAFLAKFTYKEVVISGNTNARNGLYRMIIARFLVEHHSGYEVLGATQKDWEDFKTTSDYLGFIVKRRVTLHDQ